MGGPAGGGDGTRWSPEVPSDLSQSVVVWEGVYSGRESDWAGCADYIPSAFVLQVCIGALLWKWSKELAKIIWNYLLKVLFFWGGASFLQFLTLLKCKFTQEIDTVQFWGCYHWMENEFSSVWKMRHLLRGFFRENPGTIEEKCPKKMKTLSLFWFPCARKGKQPWPAQGSAAACLAQGCHTVPWAATITGLSRTRWWHWSLNDSQVKWFSLKFLPDVTPSKPINLASWASILLNFAKPLWLVTVVCKWF